MSSLHAIRRIGIAALSFLVGNAPTQDAAHASADPYRAEALIGHRTTGTFQLTPRLDARGIEAVLGRRLCWIETPHFVLGGNLADTLMPNDSNDRRWLRRRLRQLDRALRTVRPMTSSLDTWLQLHLLADGLEAQLAEFEALAGPLPASIPRERPVPRLPVADVLGREHRFAVLLLEGESDFARFRQTLVADEILRDGDGWLHADQGGALLFACCRERGPDETPGTVALAAHLAHHATELMLRGCWRCSPAVPEWLRWGLGARFARAIDPRYTELPDEARRRSRRPDWLDLVRLRLEHRVLPSADVMFGWCNERVRSEPDAACAWSRVEFLLAIEPAGFQRYLMQWKRQPLHWADPTPARVAHWNNRCFGRAWGWDFDGFETRWADWAWRAATAR